MADEPLTPADELAAALKSAPGVKVEAVAATPPPLCLLIRLPLNCPEDVRTLCEREAEKLRKRTGLAVFCCPPGVTLQPKFEPAEMARWREELQTLRVERDDLRSEIARLKSQAARVHEAALVNAQTLAEALS